MYRLHFLQTFMLFPACLLFLLPLRRRPRFWMRYTLAVLIGVAITVPVSLFVLSFPIKSPIQNTFWIVRPLMGFGLLSLMSRISEKLALGEILYISVWAYLMRELSYHFSLVIMRYLLPESWLFDESTFFITLICHVLIYAGVYFAVAVKLPTDGQLRLTKAEIQQAVLLAALTTVFKPITVILNNGSLEFNLFALAESIGTGCVMMALYLHRGAEKRCQTEQELTLQKRLWLEHEKQMENARTNADLLNAKYHDLKHYIQALRTQGSMAEQDRILEELEQSVQGFGSAIRTGYSMLDVVLTEKKRACQHDLIQLNCVADGKLLSGMDATDLYVLFGNALDNAIECTAQLSDEQRRVISVSIFQVQEMVKIQIENPYDRSPVFKDDIPLTTKADTDSHGFGFKSIRTVAERYNGYVTATAEDGLFTLHVLLPVMIAAT